MMRQLGSFIAWSLLFGFLLLPNTSVLAQEEQRHTVHGLVVNAAQESVPFAVVLLVNPQDSSIVCHTVTDNDGRFAMGCNVAGRYWLQSHVLGYVPGIMHVDVPTRAEVVMQLKEDPKEIEAVRIGARRVGIKVQGDTVKYNLKAFATGMEKTLGDLLSNLPGIKVAEDGSVTAQGKRVEKILFNGRDLYGDNVSLATQNVSASMADSVKVVHGYSEYSLLDGFQNHDKTVIDVGVKDGMWNKISGDAEAGGGYDKVYAGRLNAMYLGTEAMVSVAAAANNVGARTFRFTDYVAMLGGLPKNEDGQYSISLDRNSYVSRLLYPPEDTKYQRSEMGALNFTYSKDKLFKVQTAALFSGGLNETERFVRGEFISGSQLGIRTWQSTRSRTEMMGGLGLINLTYNPTDSYLLKYGISGNLSKNQMWSAWENQYGSSPKWSNETWQRARPMEISQSMVHTFKVGDHQLAVTAGHTYNKGKPSLHLLTDSLLFPFTVLPDAGGMQSLRYQQVVRSHKVNAEVVGKFRLMEHQFIQVSLGNEYDHWDFQGHFGEPGAATLQPGWAGALGSTGLVGRHHAIGGAAWRKNEGLVQFTLGAQAHWLRYDARHGVGDRFGFSKLVFSPDLLFKLEFSQTHTLKLTSGMELKSRNNDQLFAGWVPRSHTDLHYAYPSGDDPFTRFYTTDLEYQVYKSDYTANVYLYLSHMYNVESVDMTENRGLLWLQRPWGRVARHSWYGFMMASQTFAVYWNANAMLDVLGQQGDDLFNGGRIPRNNWHFKPSFHLRSTYQGMWNVALRGESTFYRHQYGGGGVDSFQEWLAGAKLIFQLDPVKVEVGSGYRVSEVPGVGETVMLDAEVSYNFWGGFSLVLDGHDLLHLDSHDWAKVRTDALIRSEMIYQHIPGYVLAKLRWEFGKEKSKRSGKRRPIISYIR